MVFTNTYTGGLSQTKGEMNGHYSIQSPLISDEMFVYPDSIELKRKVNK